MEQDEMLQDVALKLDLANMELQTIDEVLARRPALSGLKHRTEKIERACATNSNLLKALEDLHRECVGLAAYLETCDPNVILENLSSIVASLKRRNELAEAAIKRAK